MSKLDLRSARAIRVAQGEVAALKGPGFSWARPSGFSPASLFASGEQGGWWDPSDLSTLWQDTAATIPVTADGQAVARINDKSGRGNHLTQATVARRPAYGTSGGLHWLAFDGVDDFLRATFAITQPFSRVSGVVFGSPIITDRQVFGGVAANAGALYFNSASTIAIFSGAALTSGSATIAAQTPYVFTELHNGTNSSLRRNAVQILSGNAGTTPPGGITLFTQNTGSPATSGRFYGATMIGRALTVEERAQLEAWTAARTGVTL